PAWEEHPAFWGLRQAYLAWRQYGLDLLQVSDLDRVQAGKAELAFSFLHDALSPTNFPVTNPAVLKRAFETGGRSLLGGWRSFIEWAVQHERTVFAISYRNPDSSMARTSMDDYLVKGPRAAMDVISEITGADKIDFVGLCLGGALTMMTATYLDEAGDDRLN